MTVLIFISVLLVLIVGHEAGHFAVAKWLKMKVLEFGVGFPPKIFGKKFSPDGTEYSVNWIPFGGFVRIFGEDAKEATDPVAFPNRPALHQALVLFAGPFANILLAVLFTTVALMAGALTVVSDENRAYLTEQPKVLIAEVLPGSPAEIAGLKPGAEIRSSETPEAFSAFVAQSVGDVSIVAYQNGEEKVFTITPVPGLISDEPDRKAIGVSTALVAEVSYPPHIALWRALVDTKNDAVFILVSFATLIGSAFTLSADVSQIAGPVGIASLTGDAVALGFGSLLSFAALLSVNLAIINLFPFPALDGGRLLFLGIETLFRRKIPLRVASAVNAAGFAILILLMLAITAQDISRLLG